MVERRSSTPYMWVRFPLPLSIVIVHQTTSHNHILPQINTPLSINNIFTLNNYQFQKTSLTKDKLNYTSYTRKVRPTQQNTNNILLKKCYPKLYHRWGKSSLKFFNNFVEYTFNLNHNIKNVLLLPNLFYVLSLLYLLNKDRCNKLFKVLTYTLPYVYVNNILPTFFKKNFLTSITGQAPKLNHTHYLPNTIFREVKKTFLLKTLTPVVNYSSLSTQKQLRNKRYKSLITYNVLSEYYNLTALKYKLTGNTALYNTSLELFYNTYASVPISNSFSDNYIGLNFFLYTIVEKPQKFSRQNIKNNTLSFTPYSTNKRIGWKKIHKENIPKIYKTYQYTFKNKFLFTYLKRLFIYSNFYTNNTTITTRNNFFLKTHLSYTRKINTLFAKYNFFNKNLQYGNLKNTLMFFSYKNSLKKIP
jgi:hypothetical protein